MVQENTQQVSLQCHDKRVYTPQASHRAGGVDIWHSRFELAICLKQLTTSVINNSALEPALTASGCTVWHAGLLGLSLSYALPITGLLSAVLSSSAETEQEMVSVERVQVSTSLVEHQQSLGLVLFHQHPELCRNTVS